MEEKNYEELSNYCSFINGKYVHVTSNESLPPHIKKIVPMVAVTDGKRIFLPESIKDDKTEAKKVCLEKIIEMQEGYYSLPEDSRPKFKEYKHKNIASVLFQTFENERYHQQAIKQFPRVFEDQNNDYRLVKNFLKAGEKLPKKKLKKLRKAAVRYVRLSQKGKSNMKTSEQFTKKVYNNFIPKKGNKKVPKQLLDFLFQLGFANGNPMYSTMQQHLDFACDYRDSILKKLQKDLSNIKTNKLEEKIDWVAGNGNCGSSDKEKFTEVVKRMFTEKTDIETRLDLKEVSDEKFGRSHYNHCISTYSKQISELKKLFEKIKPREYTKLRKQKEGDELDLEGAIEFMRCMRTNEVPDFRIYESIIKNERDVYTCFLLDISGSTGGERLTRIKEATTVLIEGLEKIGDRYMIYAFEEDNLWEVKSPKQEERFAKYKIWALNSGGGTPQSEATEDMIKIFDKIKAKTKILLTLCDGGPNDIESTKKALVKARSKNIHTYSISVDTSGREYLSDMFGENHYSICENVHELPEKAGEFYRRIAF